MTRYQGVALWLLIMFSVPMAMADHPREARQGVLDLKYWRFDHQPWLELSGKWLQYRGDLLSMKELAEKPLPEAMATPDEPLMCDPVEGKACVATYVLELRNLPTQPMSLIIPELSSAFRLTWNGRLLAEGGQVSTNAEDVTHYVGHKIAHLQTSARRAVLVLQVANTNQTHSARRYLVMGENAYLQSRFAQAELLEALSAAIAAIGCLLLLLQQRARHKYEKGLWGLALFGLATCVYTVTEGFTVLQWLVHAPDWAVIFKLNAAAQYLFVPSLMIWLAASYPRIFPHSYLWLNRIQLMLIPVIPALPVAYVIAQEDWQILYNLGLGLAGFYWLLRYRDRQQGHLTSLKFMALFIAIPAIHDALLYQRVISGMDWLPLGFTCFLVGQIFLLAVRRARQHTEVDAVNQVLSAEETVLKQKVGQRNQELQERTEQLEQVRRELHQLQHYDDLTGLLRQGHFQTQAAEQLERMSANARSQEHISLILLDLDRYKHIGAMFGPAAADQAMKDVADLLSTWAESGHLCSRLEGESFAVLLPGVSEQDAIHEAEWLRLRISQRSVSVDELADETGQIFHVTASFGVCGFTLDGADIKSMTDAAESALNRAKANGRNCVIGHHQLATLS